MLKSRRTSLCLLNGSAKVQQFYERTQKNYQTILSPCVAQTSLAA